MVQALSTFHCPQRALVKLGANDTAARQHQLQSPLVLCTGKQSNFEKAPHPFAKSAAWEFSEIISCKSLRETQGVLTVAISLFNYRDYIIPCLGSVKSQTLKDLDLNCCGRLLYGLLRSCPTGLKKMRLLLETSC